MPSRTIRPTEAPVAAPYTYTVAAPEGFAPEAVFAQWDGAGAGGDFLPCVSYYSADGVLLDRAFPSDVTLAPGDAAGVSYRPFERGGGTPFDLIVEDFITSVHHTHDVLFTPPLVVTDLGAGNAEVSVIVPPAAQAPYAYGTIAGAVGATNELAVTVTASLGFTADAHGLTAQTAGVYLLATNAPVGLSGPSLGDTSFSYFAERNHAGVSFGSLWERPEGVAAGHNLIAEGGASNPVALAIGDRVTFGIGQNGTGTVFATAGRFLLLKVA